MEHLAEKAHFLRNGYIALLQTLEPTAKGAWGKMNAQQMVEHMADYFRMASGKDPQQVALPPEQVERSRQFLHTEKPFRENTPNSLMADTPPPVRHELMQQSIDELWQELQYFFKVFEDEPDKLVVNPFFGELDYAMSVQLLHKHATHHLRQFGLTSAAAGL